MAVEKASRIVVVVGAFLTTDGMYIPYTHALQFSSTEVTWRLAAGLGSRRKIPFSSRVPCHTHAIRLRYCMSVRSSCLSLLFVAAVYTQRRESHVIDVNV